MKKQKKWKRWIFWTVGAVGAIALTVLVTVWVLVRGTPDWYELAELTPQRRDAAAQRAEAKLVTVQNEAALARATERAAAASSSSASSRDRSATQPNPRSITVSFTDDEINAFFDKWSVWQSVRASYERLLTNPRIVVKDRRIILAGRLAEIDAIASLHFEPKIDQHGRLELTLARTLAGNLPLPDALFDKYRQRASGAIARQMPLWRQQASIDRTGVANSSAISSAMSQVLMNVLNERPSDAVLFLPLVDQGSIPVKLTAMKIEDHTITLTVHPMTPAERSDLLARIKRDPM
jgi:hypothetical protein